MVGALSNIQLFVGGFNVCFGLECAQCVDLSTTVVICFVFSPFVDCYVQEDYFFCALLRGESDGLIGSVHVSYELVQLLFGVGPYHEYVVYKSTIV